MTDRHATPGLTGRQWMPPPGTFPGGWESMTTDHRLATCAGIAKQLVGLSLPAAVDAATSRGFVVRLVREDGHEFVLTMDFALRRINVTVERATVVAASPG